MAVSSRDKKLIVLVIGIAIFAIVYFAVYRPMLESNTALESENATLSGQVEELKKMTEQEEFYVSETNRIQLEVKQILTGFPSYLMIENEIMNVVESESLSNAEISSLTVSEPVLMTVGSTEDSASEEGNTVSSSAGSMYSLYDMSTNISYTSTYDGMKELLDDISGNSRKHSVSSFSATLDTSTGKITGTVSYEAYYIFGQDKNYEEPKIPTIEHGTNNIFGSIDFEENADSDNAEAEE
jgi:hypothetical protein